MMNRHPSEADLALLAGGDCGPVQRFLLNRHLSRCGDCRDTVASFSELRSELRDLPARDMDWNRLAGEMRANIHLGLVAGECVKTAPVVAERQNWVPRFAVGMAGVILLAGAGLFLRGLLPQGNLPVVHAAVVESTGTGVQVRTDRGSMTLMNGSDATADQTVTSQGAIRASYVDGSTGTVTITSVYVE